MSWIFERAVLKRLEELERKVALLRGEQDPGLSCPGTTDSECCGGKVEIWQEDGWGSYHTACPICKGSGHIYPEVK